MAAMPALGRSRARRPTDRACVMLLADGARADLFERLLEEGQLPNIARHVVERGDYRRASTVFTSTTGPAHVPFLTGMFPGTADIPGIRWFDRRKYRPDLGGGALRMRSYVGAEAGLVNADLNPRARTLFELCENPLNIFGFVTRGLPKRADIEGGRKLWLWPHAHSSGDYTQADGWAARAAERVMHRTSEFVFVMFPGIDGHAHHFAPDDERTLNSYRTVDRAVRKIANVLSHEGTYDNTLIVICSDHGHSEVLEHYDVAVALEREHGLRVAYHMGRTLTVRPEAVACVSGNGMAHLYFAAGDWLRPPVREQIEAAHPGLLARLREEPAVDVLATRAGAGELIVESRRGRARLVDTGDGVRYQVEGSDPFGFAELPLEMSGDDALERTFDSAHPDALVQVAQLARSARSGDVFLSSVPGFDLRERFEAQEHLSGHGALHAAHMHVPLAMSAPFGDGGPVRTADVYPTVLRFLGREVPEGIDGVAR